MHPYSSNESPLRIYGVLAVLAVILSWLIVTLTDRLDWPQWLVSAPSLAGTFATLYNLYDKHAWKWSALQRLGLTTVTDVSGAYDGLLTSTYQDEAGRNIERQVQFVISQTWTQMHITMAIRAQTSTSESISAVAAVSRDGTSTSIKYLYANKINPGIAESDMKDHDGAADIRIEADGRLHGRYFNARGRQGTLEASKLN